MSAAKKKQSKKQTKVTAKPPVTAKVFAFPAEEKSVAPPSADREKKPEKRLGRNIPFDLDNLRKIREQLGDVAVQEMEAKGKDELLDYLKSLAIHEEETEVAKKNDPDILDAKEKLKEASASYNETLKGIKQRRRLTVSLLQERGFI